MYQLIINSVLYIQSTRENISEDVEYPWNNISTSLKCIDALINFENIIKLPVNIFIDSLKNNFIEEDIISSIKSFQIKLKKLEHEKEKLEGKKEELEDKKKDLIKEVDELSNTNKMLKKKKRPYLTLIILTVVAAFFGYITLAIVLHSVISGINDSINSLFKHSNIHIPVLFSTLGIIVAIGSWIGHTDSDS